MSICSDHVPNIDPSVYIAENAVVVGDVTIGANSSIWFGAVLRADKSPITIGENVNIQDNSVIHEDFDSPVVIGNNITVGHRAIIHGCTIEDNCLIGMGAILLNGCRIGTGSLVAAGALVTEGQVIPPGHIAIGCPARTVKPLREELAADIPFSVNEYVELGRVYKNGGYSKADPG